MQVAVELQLGRRQRRRRDLGGEPPGVGVGVRQELVGRQRPVDQSELLGLLGQDDPAREQEVGGPGHADQAGQQPRQPVLGRQPEPPVRRRQLGALGGEPQVAVAGEHEADARRPGPLTAAMMGLGMPKW